MSQKNQNIPIQKKIFFYLISFGIPLIIIFILFISFFAYKKLTLSYDYCKSFGEIHSEIGWTLKKDVDSCLTLSNKLSGEYFFDTDIYTNSYGFRADSSRSNQKSRILSIGDSWTFGYGVNYEETFPYYLSELLEESVHNSGVPAFGSGSNFLYAKSNIEKLKPEIVIYLTIGMWRRSICEKPWSRFDPEPKVYKGSMGANSEQLIPCYLIDKNDMKAKLVKPLPGVIDLYSKKHIYPGGSLTAGYDSFWKYLLYTKPKLVFSDIKERLSKGKETATDLELYTIKKYEFNSLMDMAKNNNFTLILIDVQDDYKKLILNNEIKHPEKLVYIDSIDWDIEVIKKTIGMPDSELTVPMDGHYGKGMNELIAKLIQKKILENNL